VDSVNRRPGRKGRVVSIRHLKLVDDVEDGLAVDGEERDGREVFRLELGKELPLNQV
jgi:hypothetical protein